MITFRDINYQVDVPEIINLIHLGLSDKNTVDSFLWKHYDNSFGKSIGLLALEEEKIVGVRMFMFWEFRKGKNIVRTIRPLDTIIHPKYRGKGLFKELTLAGWEKFNREYSLVFNTPNKNSLPGYIKMEWKNYSRELKFKIGIISPSLLNKVLIETINVHKINLNFQS